MSEQPVLTSTRLMVVRPHAQGGLGQVSVALDEGLHREVALKEILPKHADQPASRERFVREAEITGGLEHPGVVPVYGIGQHDDGRPFYAMRFIKGDSLQSAIEAFHDADVPGRDPGERTLAQRQLLGRFVDICHAISYAHSRGVLHRDLKPDNVMLGDFGETLVVDWGLAKWVGQGDDQEHEETLPEGSPMALRSRGATHATRLGSAIGTPAYMSPEQAAGEIDRLSSATDVYALGGTLYAVLTGCAPIESTSQEEVLASAISGNRPRPRDVKPSVPRALEAICLQAMATDPADRYKSAADLASDIENWLADEPVAAHTESCWERAARFARRYRTFVRAAAVSLLLITAISVVASILINQQRNRAEELATANYRLAEKERAAREEEAQARQEAESVVAFMVDVFQSPDPARAGRDIKAAELLDGAVDRVETALADQPLVQAAFLHAAADSYYGLGLPSDAAKLYEQAVAIRRQEVGRDAAETLASTTNLALALQAAGRLDEALPLLEEALQRNQQTRGEDHAETINALSNLAMGYESVGRYDEALPLMERSLALALAHAGADDPMTLDAANNLASIYLALGHVDKSLPMLEDTLKRSRVALGEYHVKTLAVVNNLAQAYGAAGRPKEALALLETMLERSREKLGEDHPNTLTYLNNLAGGYQATGQWEDALALYKKSLELTQARLGDDHPSTLVSMNNLANVYQATDQIDEALPLFEETLKRFRGSVGADHPETLVTMSNLARTYQTAGRLDEAITLFEETVDRMKRILGGDHPRTLISMNNLAMVYQEAERLDDAVPLIEETLKKTRAKLGDRHPTTIVTMQNLATAYRSSDRPEDALPLFEEVVTAAIDVFGTDHPYTPTFMKSLAEAYAHDGHPEKVVTMYEKAGMEKEAAEWRKKISEGDRTAESASEPPDQPSP